MNEEIESGELEEGVLLIQHFCIPLFSLLEFSLSEGKTSKMNFHVGIHPLNGEVAVYNEKSKETTLPYQFYVFFSAAEYRDS